MDDHGAADDLANGKPVRQMYHKCRTAVSEQGREIAGVGRMGTGPGVVVSAGVCEGIRFRAHAGTSLMNVKAIDIGRAGVIALRQPADLRNHQNAVVRLVKQYGSM